MVNTRTAAAGLDLRPSACLEAMCSDAWVQAWGVSVFTASMVGLVWAVTIWLKGRP